MLEKVAQLAPEFDIIHFLILITCIFRYPGHGICPS